MQSKPAAGAARGGNGEERNYSEAFRQNETLNLLPMPAFSCDDEGRIIAFNELIVQQLGWKTGEAPEQYREIFLLYRKNGEFTPQDMDPIEGCLADGMVRTRAQVLVNRPDRFPIQVEIAVSPLPAKEGGRRGAIVCLHNVSEPEKNTPSTNAQVSYETLVNSLPVAIYTCDKDGRITYFNDVAVRLWGYRPDLLEYCACYKVSVDGFYIPPDKTPMAWALSTGRAFRNEQAEVERPDGSSFYASVNIDPIYDSAGNIVGAVNVFQDVTPLKIAELGRQQSDLRYRQLVQTLNMPIYTTDAEGTLTLFNKAAANLWGKEPNIGKDRWCGSFKMLNADGSLLSPDTCAMAICIKEKRTIIGEQLLIVRPDGTIRNVQTHPQPVFDETGAMTGAINMLLDITDLKAHEKALQLSEEKYRRLAHTLEVEVAEKMKELKQSEDRYHKMIEEVDDYAILLLDQDGLIMNWNKGAEKIKGYSEKEIVGKSFQEFYLPQDRVSGLPLRLLDEARTNGKAVHEGWRKRKNGTAFWGSVLLTALHDVNGCVIGFSKVTRDLTERKMAEDKTNEYLARLEFQNKELEQFVYAASHDLKEPLRKIHVYNSYIAESNLNKLDAKSVEYLRRSIKATGRMKTLIDDLLTYSRATVNVEAFEEVDLNQLLDDVVGFLKDEFEQKKCFIEKADLGLLRGVPFQLKQLFSNLIDNAIKYRHPDRIPRIAVSNIVVDGADQLSFQADPTKQYHKITVKDNGIGFAPEYAERIFKIFQRLSPVPTIPGSGIGLAICSKIVQNHNGFIIAEGQPGIGATFHVYIPKNA